MIRNKLPFFFIVGAAKSGTTSLHKYLISNPHILMSSPKEPKFLSYTSGIQTFNGPNDHKVEKKIIKTSNEYEKLFAKAANHCSGESSADNLYFYNEVIPKLKSNHPDSKIIILLRNPVERAFSAYTHLIRDRRETYSFEEALKLEEQRKAEGYEFLWYYKSVGLYFKQVEAYLKNFKNVKIFLFDDLKSDSLQVVEETCEFLDIPKHSANTNKVYNKSDKKKKKWRNSLYFNYIQNNNSTKVITDKLLPGIWENSISDKLKQELVQNKGKKLKLKPETRKMLSDFYKEDIMKLQSLINRDLTHWLSS